MRKSLNTTEFWMSLTVAIAFPFLAWRRLDLVWATAYFNLFVVSYLAGRVLSKKNRGQFHNGYLTSEFYFCLVATIWNLTALVLGLDSRIALGSLVGIVATFNLSRGITKSIGVKTQMVFK